MSKKIKHVLISLALATIVAFSAAMSACTIKTKHPRAQITIEFNDVTYKIEYTLYRNLYPQTVQHFIELADAGYYDSMIIHNYTSNDWFTGAYGYNDDGEDVLNYASAYEAGAMDEYLEENSKEEEYYNLFNEGKLTPSVYTNLIYDEKGAQTVSADDALPTLIGEFSNNDHVIENGALSADYGCLKMFYYSKGTTNQKVTIRNSFGELLEHDYKYNCATSIFAMQAGTSSSYGVSSYCVFATLRNSSALTAFNNLNDAIADYISDELGNSSSKFTSTAKVTVDNLDTFADEGGQGIDATFYSTIKPIIIRSVKITKY